MTIFDFLTMLGSLSLFLFGMSVMGTALEKRAGGSLKAILAKLTSGRFSGLLTGLAVTAVIQSSSATTVMVVGFVNSGLLSLRQSIPVIMGANIGTTVTAWLLSLSGISGDSLFLQLLKPSSFTPVLAVIGIILYLTGKGKKKDTGLILLGFATLMFGMESLSGSVSGLRNDPNFTKFFLMFSNPILGVLAGAILTGIVQSSSASVGILQALSSTGAVSYGAAIPIIMGQNIGTCVTAMLSSVGTNKNARRAAVVHLSFNIIGTVVWLTAFETANLLLHFSFVDQPIDTFQIAVTHSIFNVLCTLMLLPCCGLLEKLSYRLIPETDHPDTAAVLDERLFATPAIALVKSEELTKRMAADAELALHESLQAVLHFTPELAASVRRREDDTDRYEDTLGTFLVHLATQPMSEQDSVESSMLLHLIGDFERVADHAVNIIESAEELKEKGVSFTPPAQKELRKLCGGVPPGYVERQVLGILNRLIHDPQLVIYKPKNADQSLEQHRRELENLLRSPPVDEEQARKLALDCAGAALDSIGPEEYETERLRKLFGEKHLLSELDAELLRQSVRQITYTGKEVKIRLKNNQWMEG